MTKRMMITYDIHHITVQRSDNPQQKKWLATVREYPAMWSGDESFDKALKGIISMIDDALEYQRLYPEDRGIFMR